MTPKPRRNVQRSPHIDTTPKPHHNLRRSRRIRSKASANVTAPPSFPLLPADTSRSPHTPARGSTCYAGYHPDQTHPSSDPFYPSPIIGLRFNKADQGGAIAREGAVIWGEKVGAFEFLGYKYYEGMPSANNISRETP